MRKIRKFVTNIGREDSRWNSRMQMYVTSRDIESCEDSCGLAALLSSGLVSLEEELIEESTNEMEDQSWFLPALCIGIIGIEEGVSPPRRDKGRKKRDELGSFPACDTGKSK